MYEVVSRPGLEARALALKERHGKRVVTICGGVVSHCNYLKGNIADAVLESGANLYKLINDRLVDLLLLELA